MPRPDDYVIRRCTLDADGWWAKLHANVDVKNFKVIDDDTKLHHTVVREKENSLPSTNQFMFSEAQIKSWRLPFREQVGPWRRAPVDPAIDILCNEIARLETDNAAFQPQIGHMHKQYRSAVSINAALAAHVKKYCNRTD